MNVVITLNKIRSLFSTQKKKERKVIQLYIDDTKQVIVSARCIRTALKWKKKGIVDKLECEVGIPLIKSYKELGLQSNVTLYYICTGQSSYAQRKSKILQSRILQ